MSWGPTARPASALPFWASSTRSPRRALVAPDHPLPTTGLGGRDQPGPPPGQQVLSCGNGRAAEVGSGGGWRAFDWAGNQWARLGRGSEVQLVVILTTFGLSWSLMRVEHVEWDEFNRSHFNEHERCSRRQVEEVLCSNSSRCREESRSGSEARFRFEGQSKAGRYLVVIAAQLEPGVFRPITCWPLAGPNLDRYLAWRRTARR